VEEIIKETSRVLIKPNLGKPLPLIRELHAGMDLHSGNSFAGIMDKGSIKE